MLSHTRIFIPLIELPPAELGSSVMFGSVDGLTEIITDAVDDAHVVLPAYSA